VLKSAAVRGTLACAALACRRCISVAKIGIEKDTFIILYIFSSIYSCVEVLPLTFQFTN
jgi:hypothetical protein